MRPAEMICMSQTLGLLRARKGHVRHWCRSVLWVGVKHGVFGVARRGVRRPWGWEWNSVSA
jgi:hypothetical protein